MKKKEFIKQIAKYAQKEAKKRNKWVLPSVCIAQAALETGWGGSSLMTKAKAYFGIKAGSSWKGKVYSSKTKECYNGVTFTTITDLFRAYDSLADSVADYYDLICTSSRYVAAVCEKDYKKAITAIKKGGYATDPNYVKKIVSIIEANNLTEYDNIEGETSSNKSETTKKEAKEKIKAGQKVKLTKAKLYASSTTKTVAATKTGTFYAWDNKIINNRVRITTSKANVGKVNKITGYIAISHF